LGTGGPATFSTRDATGTVVGSIGADGSASFESLSLQSDPVISGLPLIGKFNIGDIDTPNTGSEILENLPWGVRGYIARTDHTTGPYAANNEHRQLQLNWRVRPYRTYRITVTPGHYVVADGFQVNHYLRYVWEASGNDPDLDSTVFELWGHKPGAGEWGSAEHTFIYRSNNQNDVMRMLYSVNPTGAFNYVSGGSWRRIALTVEDIGPNISPDGYNRNGTGVPTSPPVKSTTTYQTSWEPSAYRSYYNGGSSIQASGYGATTLKQGLDPYWTSGGIQTSQFTFATTNTAIAGETGKTMAQAFSGATISKATVSVKMVYPSSGTKTVRAYWHTNKAVTATFVPTEANLLGEWSVTSGSRVTLTLNAAARTALANGTFGGIGFGPGGSASSKYSLGLSKDYKPSITVTYTR
jgi:hypothetical protein